MQAKLTDDEMTEAIRAAFPVQPPPQRLLISDAMLNDDIGRDIVQTFMSKEWTQIGIQDWRMTGVTADIISSYMSPSSFAYYLPSLLLSSVKEKDFDYAIDAILPPNQKREPRKEWTAFYNNFSSRQKEVIKSFLCYTVAVASEDSTPQWEAKNALASNLYNGPR